MLQRSENLIEPCSLFRPFRNVGRAWNINIFVKYNLHFCPISSDYPSYYWTNCRPWMHLLGQFNFSIVQLILFIWKHTIFFFLNLILCFIYWGLKGQEHGFLQMSLLLKILISTVRKLLYRFSPDFSSLWNYSNGPRI